MIDVKTEGALFKGNTEQVVLKALDEVVDKVGIRILRPQSARRQKSGVANNRLTRANFRNERETSVSVDTTLHWPRTTGSSWRKKHLGATWTAADGTAGKAKGIIGAMLPNALRSAIRKVLDQL